MLLKNLHEGLKAQKRVFRLKCLKMCLKAETFKTVYEGLWEEVLNTSSQRVHKYLHSVQNFDLHILKQGGGGSMKA